MSHPSSRIIVGSRVSSKIGPLVHRSSASTASGSGRTRKVRSVYHGTVVSLEPRKMWLVHWDECDKTSVHKSSQLKFIKNPGAGELNSSLMDMWKKIRE